MIVVNSKFVPKVARAIAIWPYIFFKTQQDVTPVRVNHEKIHLEQQKECLLILFYLIYGINYLVNLVRFKGDWFKAYQCICFEVEAGGFELDMDYLKHRKRYSWLGWFL